MEFTKMHGAGNDFVVVDGRKLQRDWSKLAITVLDRHRGIGADSLIIVLPSTKADFGMRTWDTDGSESETCGNGLRCVARFVLEKGMIPADTEEVTIETLLTINRVKLEREGGKVVSFRANMGQPWLAADKIPVNVNAGNGVADEVKGMTTYRGKIGGRELTLNMVSMGNPHAVFFSDKPVAEFPLAKIGPMVENLSIFPNRVNFEVARVLDKTHIEARVWERGVGETLACGSGTGAITVASKLSGYTGSEVHIKLPGGVIGAEWNGSREVVQWGPAVVVYDGKWPD
jgi:diaminopimelate epimerase